MTCDKKVIFTLISIWIPCLFLGVRNQTLWAAKDLGTEEILFQEIPIVVSASKTPLKINRAPGTVYVFSQRDLQNMGIKTLRDLGPLIPGIQVDPERQGHYNLSIRGIQNRYNNKILLLIDGVPIRDLWYGNFLIDEMIPIEMIDNVEIVLGPGSVLYGTNAFAGIVNITTKQRSNDATVRYGPYQTFETNANLHVRDHFSVFAEYLNASDGFAPRWGRDGIDRRTVQKVDRNLVIVSGKLKILKGLTLSASKTVYSYPYTYSRFTSNRRIRREPFTTSLNFTTGDAKSLKINAIGYYVNYPFSDTDLKYSKSGALILEKEELQDRGTQYGGADVYLTKKAGDHTVVLGTAYMRDQALGKIVETKTDFTKSKVTVSSVTAFQDEIHSNYSFYLQDVWQLHPQLDLTAGVRYDRVDRFNYNDQFNYRIGLVYVTQNDYYMKSLFGTAFRIPNIREYGKLNGIVPAFDPNLKTEHLKTLELMLGKNFQSGNVQTTFFYNRYIDYIFDEFDAAADDEVSRNIGRMDVFGMEAGGTISVFKKLIFRPGIAYMDARDQNTNKELPGLAKLTGFLDVNFQVDPKFSLGAASYYSGPRNVDTGYQKNVPLSNQDPHFRDSYVTFNAHAKYEFSRYFNIQLIGKNILNRKYYSPHLGPTSDMDYEHPPAELLVQSTVKW